MQGTDSKGKARAIAILLAFAAAAAPAFGLTACSSDDDGSSSDDAEEEKVYIDEADFDSFFNSPSDYVGQYIHMTGVIINTFEQDGDTYLNVAHDAENYEQAVLVQAGEGDTGYVSDDYVIVDGKVDSVTEAENIMGGTEHIPLIVDATIDKTTYTDAVAPTIDEVEYGASAEESGFTATVDRIEYAESETRVFMTVSNGTDSNISFGGYEIRMVVDGQQVEQDSSSGTTYMDESFQDLPGELSPGASASGELVFPAMDQRDGFQVVVPDIYSDDQNVGDYGSLPDMTIQL